MVCSSPAGGGQGEGRATERLGRDLFGVQRAGDVGDGWTDARGDGGEGVEVEAVDAGCVAAHHGRDVVGRDVAEGQAQVLVRPGPAALPVREVVAPHDAVDADRVAQADLVAADEAGADVALAGP